jgi:hypothetical protein
VNWEEMRYRLRLFEDLLSSAGTGDGYVRNWTIHQPLFAPCLDLRLEPIPDLFMGDFDGTGATQYADGIAADEVPAAQRLPAGTKLSVVDGTNSLCDGGWESTIFMVQSGPRAGLRIVFFDEFRWGLEPTLAKACLRRFDARRLGDAAREEVRQHLAEISRDWS